MAHDLIFYKKPRMVGREHLVQHSGTGGFDSPQEVIQHYGVKGMKWGVRNTPDALAAKRAKLQGQKSEASSKTTSALAKQTKVQTKALRKLSTGKDIGYLQRRSMKKAGKEAVRALKSEKKLNRKIKRVDSKITRLDKKLSDRGKNVVHEVLDAGAIVLATLNE